MIRASRRTLLLAALLSALLCAPFAAGAARRSASCSTHGLSVSGSAGAFRVVGLDTTGLSCSAARAVAHEVADDLLKGRALSLGDASGFSISQTSCSGCAGKTQVSISYARGSVSVSLQGSSSATPATPALPAIPDFPTTPLSPANPGGGSGVITL